MATDVHALTFQAFLNRLRQTSESWDGWTVHGTFPTTSIQPEPVLFQSGKEQDFLLITNELRALATSCNIELPFFLLSSLRDLIHSFLSIPRNAFLYSTRFEPENEDSTGIICYDIDNGTTSPLLLWHKSGYYPRWNLMLYNRYAINPQIVFIGGSNVLNEHKEYKQIAIFDLNSRDLELRDVDFMVGTNCKAVMVNENQIHIIGGKQNALHILYDLKKGETQFMYDFNDRIEEQGLYYDEQRETLLMFGGYVIEEERYLDTFWRMDLKGRNVQHSMARCTSLLVHGFMTREFLKWNEVQLQSEILQNGYEVLIHRVIMQFVGDTMITSRWQKVDKFQMKRGLRSFGSVFYDHRVIVVFGGISGHRLVDRICYLDIEGEDGWKESSLRCPQAGMCNAVMVGDDVHLVPYYAWLEHYSISITKILPSNLLRC